MKNIGAWYTVAVIGVMVGKEFLDWVWWYNWEDDEDEVYPAQLIYVMWAVWQSIDAARSWLSWRTWRYAERSLDSIWYHFFPPEVRPEPIDEDGRTPSIWLLIYVLGVWEVYKNDYDWQVKLNWDEYMKTQKGDDNPEWDEWQKH